MTRTTHYTSEERQEIARKNRQAERKAIYDLVVFLYVTLLVLIGVVGVVIGWFPKYKLIALVVVVGGFVACMWRVLTAKLGYHSWEYK